MSDLLFTGFPGFLGSSLLPRLASDRPGMRAVCLVQARWMQAARTRLATLERDRPGLRGRVELREGDLLEPGLGLDRGALGEVEEVVHLAALYDLSRERDAALRVNRGGTRRVLDLCRDLPALRRLHYVSTCYVSGRHRGTFRETDLDVGQTFNNAYEETKHLAELEVRDAMEEGLPATVYRPAAVVGDAATGATQKYDGPYTVIRLLLRQPAALALLPVPGDPKAASVNVVPRDWMVEAMARLAHRPETVGRVFHLADPRPLTVDAMIDVLADATGRRVVRVPVPMGVARWATRRVPGVAGLTGIPHQALPYFLHPTRYATAATQEALDGFGPPGFASYAGTLVDFVRAHPDLDGGAMA